MYRLQTPPDSGAADVDPPSAQQQPEPREREVPAGFEDALKDAIKEIDGRTGLGPDLKVDTAKLDTDVLLLLKTAPTRKPASH